MRRQRRKVIKGTVHNVRFSNEVGHFDRNFLMEGDVAPAIVGVRKLECLGCLTVRTAYLVTEAVPARDKQTDGQN